MIETIVAGAVLSVAVVQYVRSRPVRREVRRLERISDDALTLILRLFPKRSPSNSWRSRAADWRFVDSISIALADKALTAEQIRRLFDYTHGPVPDIELKRIFGWDDALREAAAAAEEEAAKPAPPPPPLPPLIGAADFATLKKELGASAGDDVESFMRRWPFSYTRAQVAEILDEHAKGKENAKVREIIRRHMPVCS